MVTRICRDTNKMPRRITKRLKDGTKKKANLRMSNGLTLELAIFS